MISSTLLSDIATFTNDKIDKVVINESYEITDFTAKNVDESTVGMQYIVPQAATTLVTKIELKSSADELITSNDVYIPITSDTLLLQTIEVKEVI